MKKLALGLLLVVPGLLQAASAHADDGRVNAGKKLYAGCVACHKLDASGTSGIGPNLHGIAGRRAGTVPGFRYSPAMVAWNRAWTDANLDAYLAAPARTIPGNRMPYVGMRNPADRRILIAYLKSASR